MVQGSQQKNYNQIKWLIIVYAIPKCKCYDTGVCIKIYTRLFTKILSEFWYHTQFSFFYLVTKEGKKCIRESIVTFISGTASPFLSTIPFERKPFDLQSLTSPGFMQNKYWTKTFIIQLHNFVKTQPKFTQVFKTNDSTAKVRKVQKDGKWFPGRFYCFQTLFLSYV